MKRMVQVYHYFLQVKRVANRNRSRGGFTLIELLVVVAIIAILVGLTLPAVQQVRETARRTECSNNMRQMGLALNNFHSTQRHYPLGSEFETNHSWGTHILPFMEQTNVHRQIDFDVVWNEPGNEITQTINLAFECPTSIKGYDGKTDYSGISGSVASGPFTEFGENGILIVAYVENQKPISTRDVSDGLSHTILVAEGVAVQEENCGFWACGLNCFTHEDGGVNNLQGGFNEIASLHPGGANTAQADGSIRFLDETVDPEIVSALCTRNGGEVIPDFAP